jgi:hypothetical protein
MSDEKEAGYQKVDPAVGRFLESDFLRKALDDGLAVILIIGHPATGATRVLSRPYLDIEDVRGILDRVRETLKMPPSSHHH